MMGDCLCPPGDGQGMSMEVWGDVVGVSGGVGWCGVGWCGVVWCGVVWGGVVGVGVVWGGGGERWAVVLGSSGTR